MFQIEMKDKEARGTLRRMLACCGLIGEGRPDWLEILNSHLAIHGGHLDEEGQLNFESRENFDSFIEHWSDQWQEVHLPTHDDHEYIQRERTETIHKWLVDNGLIRDRDWAHDNWTATYWFESARVASLFLLRWA